MESIYTPVRDTFVIPSHLPVPGFGILPVNAFVIKAREPVLVDSGLFHEQDEFITSLGQIIDPQDLKWLWLSHTDLDHIGSVGRLLDEAPNMHVITTFIGAGKMGMLSPLPMDRVYFLNPGQSIDVGDRKLTAVKPPSFDAPETTGFIDGKSRALFTSDCFGAIVSSHAEDAREIAEKELAESQMLWATVDSPWLHSIDRRAFDTVLQKVRGLSPSAILSSHLPAAEGMTDQFLRTLAAATEVEPFVGPDQAVLEQTIKAMTEVPEAVTA